MNTQAIIKASYTRASALAKANIRYIQHRRGKEGQKITRELFGVDGTLQRLQAYELIDAAEKGTVFFRLVISPPQIEDLHLAEITSQTMRHLAERMGKEVPYIAAVHNDHSPHQHVHCLALVQGRLNTQDFHALRERTTEVALEQRKERELAREQQQQAQAKSDLAREGGGLALQR